MGFLEGYRGNTRGASKTGRDPLLPFHMYHESIAICTPNQRERYESAKLRLRQERKLKLKSALSRNL